MILQWLQNDARMHGVECFRACYLNPVLVSTVFVSFSTKTFIFFVNFKVLFGESPGFSPRWGPLSLSPSQFVQLCWATLYSSDHQASRNLFSGPFRTPAQTFSFFSPHYIPLCLQNQAPKKCQVSQGSRSLILTKSTSFKTYTGEIRK